MAAPLTGKIGLMVALLAVVGPVLCGWRWAFSHAAFSLLLTGQ